MKPDAIEIQKASASICTKGWLTQCPKTFSNAILAKSQWIAVDADQPIALGDEADGGLFGVAEGTVGIIPTIAAADVGLIHIAPAPFWFGLQPFVNGEGRMITVQARKRCVVAHLTKPALAQILKEHPEGWRMLLMCVTQMTALAVQGASDHLLPDQYRRCGALLLRLAGTRKPGAIAQDVECSQDELAAMCNLSRASVSKVLGHFEEQRMLEVGYRRFRIIDANRLRHMVDAS
jgi:CRP/FNR family cyclic AMP-dependent transcriptional regulator